MEHRTKMNQQHLDKLQAIAEYEQALNVSPEERIVEMNYSTAHWQPKEGITPDQAEAVYNHITGNQRIGFERANEIRQSVGNLPLAADEYYSNIKNMAYVERFTFGDDNSVDIETIQSALNEVPAEYVISQMTSEQLDLYADYYETSLDFAKTAAVNFSHAEQQLYDAIINIRKNNLSVTNDSPTTDQLSIDNISFDNDNYMHFSVDADGYRIPGYFRVFDPANGTDMEIVSIDNWDRHPIISKQWDSLTQQCRSASLEKYRELTGQDYSFSNEILENKATLEAIQSSELPKIDVKNKPLSKDEFDKLTSEIQDIAETYQNDPELLTDYLAFKAQFYQYSPTNTMLIYLQNPHATFVASFTKWKQMGYSIKKGQHHIKISRPIEVSKFPKDINGKMVWTDVKYASPEEKAKIAEGKLEIKKTTKFIPHQVFDISQTNCPVEDYPKFYNMGHPDMEQHQLYECVKQYAKESGFTVAEEDLSSISLHGYYNKADDSIHINSLLEDSKRLETMCHELAHGVLHKTSTQPTEIRELEAESFAAMLKRKMGFPVSEESKRYIKQYATKCNKLQGGKFEMGKTLDRLSKAFNHVTDGIESTMTSMGFAPKREIAQNLSQAQNNSISVSKISENFMNALS